MFGDNEAFYSKYGHEGHNGYDFPCPEGTKIFAPFDGYLEYGSDPKGYGTYITIVNHRPYKKLKVILAHLSKVEYTSGGMVHAGELVALSGNTGNSTGPHLHMTLKSVDMDGKTLDKDNGVGGALDFLPHMTNWKGTHLKHSL